MQELSVLTFRITPWRPWLLALTLVAPLAGVGVVVSVAAGDRAAARGILLGFAAAAMVLLLLISLAVGVSRWHVYSTGFGGRNNWLIYRRLTWTALESVEPWMIPGYPYLQVNGGGRRWAFWLPLFLTDMPGFRAAVARYAPPDNPLRRYLEDHPASQPVGENE